ncbi:hypothetical protein NIES4071_62990 [Calothrix sp. NIES-4071]|nr:hypothetical protein NIES4071_62990 [Calothrix sp. NIES-4071]BAZ60602.1 hypothetical protein NIES4105_62940 [Calothrix sp. NIES-4105]
MSLDKFLNQDLQQQHQILNKNDKANQAKQQSDKQASSSNLIEELNTLYAEEDSSLDPFFVSLQALSLSK